MLVGLIGDARGRWLVNQRRPGTDLAGFWEFPGGKRHTDETPFAALRRELDEELGIDVLAAEPWLELVHDYPDKKVLLDVWRVLDYRGEVSAREGQALDWVAVGAARGVAVVACRLADRRRAARRRYGSQQIASRKRTSWLT